MLIDMSRFKTLFGLVKQKTCKHEFGLKDLERTEFPEPAKPAGNDFNEWMKWHSDMYKSDCVQKRVKWPCCKCGEVFYASCGLDIYKHGAPKRMLPETGEKNGRAD